MFCPRAKEEEREICVCVCVCVRAHVFVFKGKDRKDGKRAEKKVVRQEESSLLSLGRVQSRCFWNKCVQVCTNVRVWPLQSAECLCVCGCVSAWLPLPSQTLTDSNTPPGRCSQVDSALTCSTVQFSYLLAPAYLSIKSQLKGLC